MRVIILFLLIPFILLIGLFTMNRLVYKFTNKDSSFRKFWEKYIIGDYEDIDW